MLPLIKISKSWLANTKDKSNHLNQKSKLMLKRFKIWVGRILLIVYWAIRGLEMSWVQEDVLCNH